MPCPKWDVCPTTYIVRVHWKKLPIRKCGITPYTCFFLIYWWEESLKSILGFNEGSFVYLCIIVTEKWVDLSKQVKLKVGVLRIHSNTPIIQSNVDLKHQSSHATQSKLKNDCKTCRESKCVWNRLDQQNVRTLIKSMRQRCLEVIANEGEHTNYWMWMLAVDTVHWPYRLS